jgi:hypothetical protein
LGAIWTLGDPLAVAVQGSYAYVVAWGFGLQVVDITDPAFLEVVGNVITPGDASGIAVDGNYAYVADGPAGLQLISIADPTAPVLLGSVDTPGDAVGVSIIGRYAYVTNESVGFHVIDHAVAMAPKLVGGRETPGWAHGIAVDENHVYVGDGETGLLVSPLQCEFVESIHEIPGTTAPRVRIWPNPTSTSVMILLDLARAASAEVAVHDITGRRICRLARGTFPAGAHGLKWDGRDGHGRPAPAGHYWIRIAAAGRQQAGQLVVVR